MHTNFLSSSYVAARDERTKEALRFLANYPESLSCVYERKSGARIVRNAHFTFMVAALAVIVSPLAASVIVVIGIGAMLVGVERLLRGERIGNNVLVMCLREVDVARPELIETMEKCAHERAKEKWSTDTI